MCLALYQRAPRLDDAPSDTRMAAGEFGPLGQGDIRQLLRRGTSTGWAEVDFRAVDGICYRVRWGFRAPRKKGAAVQEEASLVRLDTQTVVRTFSDRKDAFRAHVDSLTGMTWNQFTRTVLLAQGRFAEFLRSGENERGSLLERLTGTSIFSRISAEVFRRSRAEAESFDSLRRRREGILRLDLSRRDQIQVDLRQLLAELPRLQEKAKLASDLLEGSRRLETMAADQDLLSREVETGKTVLLRLESEVLQMETDASQAEQALAAIGPEMEQARELDHRRDSLAHSLDQARTRLARNASLREEHQGKILALETALREDEARLESIRSWLERNARLDPVAGAWTTVDHLLAQMETLQERSRRSAAELERCRAELSHAAEELAQAEAGLAKAEAEMEGQTHLLSEDSVSLQAKVASTQARVDRLEALRDRERIREEVRDLTVQIQVEGKALEAAEIHLPPLEAAEQTARAMLEIARLATSKDVHTLREILREGDPCPVCGSLEHPWRESDVDSLPAFHAQDEFHRQSLRNLEEARLETVRLEGSIQGLRLRQERLVHQESLLPTLAEPSAEESAQFQDLSNTGTVLDGLLRALEFSLRERRSLQTALERRLTWDQVNSQVALKSQARAHKRKETDALEMRRSEVEDHLEAVCAELDAHFRSRTWRESLQKDPQFRRKLAQKVEEHSKAKRDLDEFQRKNDLALERLGALKEELPRIEEDRHAAFEDLRSAQQSWDEASEARSRVLGGRAWKEILQELTDRKSRLAEELSIARSSLIQARESHARREGELSRLATEIVTIGGRIEELSLALDIPAGATLDPAGLAGQALQTWRSEEARRASLSATLEQDDLAIARGQSLEHELERQGEIAARWGRLSKEIGSADGKAFRRIAQQITLERLLDRANRELTFLAPRYRLRMVPDSLHFGIEDRESFEEIRPVHTLSGGETFLVSLALALALSSLASGNQAIETLFIDEGFGTLDGTVLTEVVQALERLHASGRQVGIVTHVEELKDQVAALVEVRRLGPGRSEVLVHA